MAKKVGFGPEDLSAMPKRAKGPLEAKEAGPAMSNPVLQKREGFDPGKRILEREQVTIAKGEKREEVKKPFPSIQDRVAVPKSELAIKDVRGQAMKQPAGQKIAGIIRRRKG